MFVRHHLKNRVIVVHEYNHAKKWQPPEPDLMMSAKGYRDKKAFPLVKKLKEVIFNLTIQLNQKLTEIQDLRRQLREREQRIAGQNNHIFVVLDVLSFLCYS